MRPLAAAATLVFALVLAGAAHASTVLYTFSGTGTGSLNGTPFTKVGFNIFLGGDPVTVKPGGVDNTFQVNPLDFAIVRIAGFADAAIIQTSLLGVNRDTNGIYFERASGLNLLDFLDLFVSESDEQAFDFSAPYGPVGGIAETNGNFANVPTSQGLLTLSTVSVVSFAAAVPEPTAWILMFVGLGAAGTALRRRRSRRVLNLA